MRKKERPMCDWQIEKDGYKFSCRYDPKTDFVYVYSLSFESGTNSALAKNSGHLLMANILASELIQRKDVDKIR